MTTEDIWNVLRSIVKLSPRERAILGLRLGLGFNPQYTLEQTAHHFGVTRERIRQIEAKAIERLQSGNFGNETDSNNN